MKMLGFLASLVLFAALNLCAAEPLRVLIETDAGGDPDDEQSLVRFLHYVNEWDIEGIIANRARAREGENRNTERTGLAIVRRLLNAYGECWPNLVKHDSCYPTRETLWQRTVAGYDDLDDGVNLIIAEVDRPDTRPIWYSDWGTDSGGATNNLRRALDRVLQTRGLQGYRKFKGRLRLVSADAFGEHTTKIAPPFSIWVNTFQPEWERKRWYHQFSAITARAGGFDLRRDVLNGHGPLGALYPTNTTHWQKEGDTMTFLYLVPTGMNHPEHPEWGSWAGRYGRNEDFGGSNYYWANQVDRWNGTTNRDNTLRRWAEALQNDFRARLDWDVKPRGEANHPPIVKLLPTPTEYRSGETIQLDASGSTDPDGDALSFSWCFYPEPVGGPLTSDLPAKPRITITLPEATGGTTIQLIVAVTDDGTPPLSRYGRVGIKVK